jgi:putative ABC transport system permease protein
MSFAGLIGHNVVARWLRSLLTAIAVAVGVGSVVTLGIVTHSLRGSAAAILKTGEADFTVAQSGVSDVLNSTIDPGQLQRIAKNPKVASAVGALITTTKLNAQNPLFIEIGLKPSTLRPFGVDVVAGRAFRPAAKHEIMLGYRAADNLHKHVGDAITVDGNHYTVVGLFQTGQSIGDAASMIPLVTMQAEQREPGLVTLAFVQVKPGVSIPKLRKAIHHQQPNLTTVRFATDFGRVDRNLQLITAADHGATYLALLIGAVIVTNTMLLSFFERTREFGILRAVGWARTRLMVMVIGEALIISVFGAALGVGLAFGVLAVLERLPQLTGYLHPVYQSSTFWRALYTAAGIGFLGALYPAARAGLLHPITALRRE